MAIHTSRANNREGSMKEKRTLKHTWPDEVLADSEESSPAEKSSCDGHQKLKDTLRKVDKLREYCC